MRSGPATLLLTRSDDPGAIRAACRAAAERSRSLLVVGPHADTAPHRQHTLPLSEDADVSVLARQRWEQVLLHGFADDAPLPGPLLREIFSRPVSRLRHVDPDGSLRDYRPHAHLEGRARALVVFPGAPIPLDKGSNQRAFSMVSHLNRSGVGTDLLLTTASRRDLPRLRDVLRAIAPTVHTYRNDKPALPAKLRLRREAERVYRLARGRPRRGPDLFVDRLATRASHDGRRRLSELVGSGRYDSVVVSFAWMTGLLDAARPSAPPGLRWYCDTHDVQFVRGATLDAGEPRLWVDHDGERRAELAQLEKYDAVLAISESDRDELVRHMPEERVVLARAGFDYAHQPLGADPSLPPYTFGFVGRDMDANVRALELLLDEWWPAIASAAPGSRLLVAGTIADRGEIRRRARPLPGVELLGFVPSLASFYQRIQIALNPVVVQGGLNFKSLEAVAAGCLLITTPRGRACLGSDAHAIVVDGAGELQSEVRTLVEDPIRAHAARRRGQRWCAQGFSDDVAYRDLRGLLAAG